MLDETWGLSNKSWKYEGKFSNYGSKSDQNMAQKLKQKYVKGIKSFYFVVLLSRYISKHVCNRCCNFKF